MSTTGRPCWPGSRCLMNQAFSAKRQPSTMNGLPNRCASSAASRMLARRSRLTAARVVGDRDHDAGDGVAVLAEESLEPREVHVPLERMRRRRVESFRRWQVDRLGAGCFDIAARGVEMRVRGNLASGSADQMKQDRLGRAALMRWDDVAERHEVAHRLLEAAEGGRTGVALVTEHDRRPLLRAHRRGAGIGQEVDQHVVGSEPEKVVMGVAQEALALLLCREPQRFHGLDSERFDDCLHGASFPPRRKSHRG